MGKWRDLDGDNLDVVETMKGSLPAQVTVRLPGGRVGHLTATVDGTPKFNPGSEAIVFLERSRSGGFSVAGWVEGTFRIARDPRTSRETVTQDSSAFAVFDPATRSFISEGIRGMPVEQFRARVATAIARAAGENTMTKIIFDRNRHGIFLLQVTAATAGAYTLGSAVGDMRQAASQSGGTSCPQLTRFDVSTPGTINRQWSTSLGNSPATILTADQTPAGQLNEIEAVIQQSLAAWTGVSGASLQPSSLGTLQRTSSASACDSSDGLNSICFNQNDAGFAIGVLAFTRVVTADTAGEQLSPSTPPSTFVGQILDADVLLRPARRKHNLRDSRGAPNQSERLRP